MGDDVGIMEYQRLPPRMMGGSTPNIDRISKEGALFTTYTLSNLARRDAPVHSRTERHSVPAC